MRLTSQNNQFVFSFPRDLLSKKVMDMYRTFIDRSHVQYDDVLEYLNSTIKSINFPGINLEPKTQTRIRGKKIQYKGSENIHDLIGGEITITLKSVDSHTNYFMLQQIFAEYYNNTRKYYMPWISLYILDKDGDYLYTVVFRSVLLKSLSEIRLMYQAQDMTEQTFSITFKFNFIDIYWDLSESPDAKKERIFDTETWDHSNDILPLQRPQNDYNL